MHQQSSDVIFKEVLDVFHLIFEQISENLFFMMAVLN